MTYCIGPCAHFKLKTQHPPDLRTWCTNGKKIASKCLHNPISKISVRQQSGVREFVPILVDNLLLKVSTDKHHFLQMNCWRLWYCLQYTVTPACVVQKALDNIMFSNLKSLHLWSPMPFCWSSVQFVDFYRCNNKIHHISMKLCHLSFLSINNFKFPRLTLSTWRKSCMFKHRSVDFEYISDSLTRTHRKVLRVTMVFICDVIQLTNNVSSFLTQSMALVSANYL